MNGFIAKPVDRAQMIRVIDENLRHAGLAERTLEIPEPAVEAKEAEVTPVSSEIEILDRQVFEQFSNDVGTDFRDTLVEEFVTETAGKVDSIGLAIQAGDFEEAQRLSHSLKSGAGTFGAIALQRCAERLEAASAMGDRGGLDRLHAELVPLAQRSVERVRAEAQAG